MGKKYNVIDLFCGCGGFSSGFGKENYNILLGVDNDPSALKTFELNHKNTKCLCADIKQISYADSLKPLIGDAAIDVIIGGPPCQGMSLSGPRKFNDPRNSLYLSFIRLVDEVRPRAFVIENVTGLVSLFKGEIKDSIISKFADMGYSVTYQILTASNYGVPQNRKRVIFVGLLGSTFKYPEPKEQIITCEMALSDLPPLVDDVGSDFSTYTKPAKNAYQSLMRENSAGLYNHVAAVHADRVKHIISLVPDGGNYKDLPEEFRNTRNFNVAWTRFNSQKPAPTIDTGHRHHFHYKYNRVPTVRESARLQSFPDDFIFLGNKTQQFRQVGNAVPPLMAQAIAKQLYSYL